MCVVLLFSGQELKPVEALNKASGQFTLLFRLGLKNVLIIKVEDLFSVNQPITDQSQYSLKGAVKRIRGDRVSSSVLPWAKILILGGISELCLMSLLQQQQAPSALPPYLPL